MDIPKKHLWWQTGIIYQIYPRSFMDGNGDGVGDLTGIIDKLDYLQWLGIDALWLSPIFCSPMADFGYDVSDYTDIDPLFGTLADFVALVMAAHARGIKLILDFVPNHTSDRHPWFAASRASRTDAKRAWYLWRDPAPGGGPPNNWLSNFGGSAWEWDDATGQYYYHAFLKEQPDLNWRNPEVRAAMFDALRFWLERGVDGFRIDVMHHIIKDEEFRDNPPNPDYLQGSNPYRELLTTYSVDRPEVQDIVTGMRQVLDEYDERMMVGEIYLPVERLMAYYGEHNSGAHLPFNFQLIKLPWHAGVISAAVEKYEALLPPESWPNWVLGNHDKSRIASRVGEAQARVAAMLLLTLRGTPTLYYGDELGMRDVPIPPDRVRDPFEKNVPGLGLGRDPVRTPMQWNDEPRAGFTTGEPWLPLADNAAVNNVAIEREEPDSMLSLYRRLITLRRAEPALTMGKYVSLNVGQEVIAYLRQDAGDSLLVLLNLSDQAQTVDLVSAQLSGRCVLSTYLDRQDIVVSGMLELRGDEGIIILRYL